MRQQLVILALSFCIATPALAQSRRVRSDAMLNDLWAPIQERENVYFAANGRYFQGLLTPRNVRSVDGSPNHARKPITGQKDSWADAGFVLPSPMPASIEIHVYDGPQGKGYTTILHYKSGGKRFTKARSFGPEAAWRTHGWVEVKP